MLIIRSVNTGKILGFAHDQAIALRMATANGWMDWYVESDEELRELRMVPKTKESTDDKTGGADR